MEAIALYLFKSAIWATGFALVYIVFLQNERFFALNRIYLIAGILTSFIFPLITIRYTVLLHSGNYILASGENTGNIHNVNGNNINMWLRWPLLVLYLSGMFLVLTRLIYQTIKIMRSIERSEIVSMDSVKLIRTSEYSSSFSFFSYVFINPSATSIETKEIMNHEMVHVRQKHWIDLMLAELLCMVQWFNPMIWIYFRMMRQNHEYLADQEALQLTSDPAVYKAALLNQIFGIPVVSLANSFNYSLNKKRFNMMKNIIISPYRKMRILLILPFMAIALYAFAQPEYKYETKQKVGGNTILSQDRKEAKGKVVQKSGEPIEGALILIKGSTEGTVTDSKGEFTIKTPEKSTLLVVYAGFISQEFVPDFKSDVKIILEKDSAKTTGNVAPVAGGKADENKLPFAVDGDKVPLFYIDDVLSTYDDVKKIDPATIESISILKNEKALKEYGEKGKNGVVLVKTKNK